MEIENSENDSNNISVEASLNKISVFCYFMVYRMYKDIHKPSLTVKMGDITPPIVSHQKSNNNSKDEYYVVIPCDEEEFKKIEKKYGDNCLTNLLRKNFPGWSWDVGNYGITEELKKETAITKYYLSLPDKFNQKLCWLWCEEARNFFRNKQRICVSRWNIVKNDMYNICHNNTHIDSNNNNNVNNDHNMINGIRFIGQFVNPLKYACTTQVEGIAAAKNKKIMVHFGSRMALIYKYRENVNTGPKKPHLFLHYKNNVNINYVLESDKTKKPYEIYRKLTNFLAYHHLFALDEFHFEKINKNDGI